MKIRKLAILALAMLLAANVSTVAAADKPGNGFEDYLCRIWHGWEICRVHPGKGPK